MEEGGGKKHDARDVFRKRQLQKRKEASRRGRGRGKHVEVRDDTVERGVDGRNWGEREGSGRGSVRFERGEDDDVDDDDDEDGAQEEEEQEEDMGRVWRLKIDELLREDGYASLSRKLAMGSTREQQERDEKIEEAEARCAVPLTLDVVAVARTLAGLEMHEMLGVSASLFEGSDATNAVCAPSVTPPPPPPPPHGNVGDATMNDERRHRAAAASVHPSEPLPDGHRSIAADGHNLPSVPPRPPPPRRPQSSSRSRSAATNDADAELDALLALSSPPPSTSTKPNSSSILSSSQSSSSPSRSKPTHQQEQHTLAIDKQLDSFLDDVLDAM